MKLYHRTSKQASKDILTNGFKDATGNYLTTNLYTGVWLSDIPLDPNEGTQDGPLLSVELNLSEEDLAKYEWVEEGKPYREFLVPAAVINAQTKAVKES